MSPYDIRIDGTFEGKVQTKGRVVVGESADVKGDVICENIDLWGKMDGNVFVKNTLSLKDGCTVNGNLNVRRLSVELGSTFNGNCRMITEEEFDKIAGIVEKDQKASMAQKQGAHPQKAQPASPAN